MPRGKKVCDKCGCETGPRAYVCPECGTPFIFKPRSKEHKNTKVIRNFNWKELENGDKIKVSGGPYWLSSDGEYIPMGCRGKFTVLGLDKNGIIAHGVKEGGFCHIYMGEDDQCKSTQIWRTKHKLSKLKPKQRKE